jgi:hypothetical protein
MKNFNPIKNMKNMKTRSFLACLLALACWLGQPLCARAATLVVTNLADSGPGTLRSAVAVANTNAGGADITFDPALSGQTVLLTSGQLTLSNQFNLTIDASSLPAASSLTPAATPA